MPAAASAAAGGPRVKMRGEKAPTTTGALWPTKSHSCLHCDVSVPVGRRSTTAMWAGFLYAWGAQTNWPSGDQLSRRKSVFCDVRRNGSSMRPAQDESDDDDGDDENHMWVVMVGRAARRAWSTRTWRMMLRACMRWDAAECCPLECQSGCKRCLLLYQQRAPARLHSRLSHTSTARSSPCEAM